MPFWPVPSLNRDPFAYAPRWAKALRDQLNRMEKHMADKSAELQASLDALATTVTDAVTEIEAQLKIIVNPGTPDAAVDAAVARINGLTDTLKTEVANLRADNPPA